LKGRSQDKGNIFGNFFGLLLPPDNPEQTFFPTPHSVNSGKPPAKEENRQGNRSNLFFGPVD